MELDREADATPSASLGARAGKILFYAWAAVFVAGALGALFEIEFLQRVTDLKRIFLR